MRAGFFSIFLLLAGCASDIIIWHNIDGPELQIEARKAGFQARVRGFTKLGPPCHIYVPSTDYEAILHELRHCKEGRFH